jgi:GNAT superfamily N-acetyltransferase
MAKPIVSHQPNLRAAVHLRTRDGRTVAVRHMRREDADLLERMFYRLSSETRYRRFFVPLDHIEGERVKAEARRLATIDPNREVALLAVAEENGREEAVAVARYSCLDDTESGAEGSIVVRDDYQGAGLGAQLFDLLIQTALASGLRHMVLITHADNTGMIGLVQHLGLPYQGHYASGLYEIDLQLSDGEQPLFPFSRA